MLVECHFTGRQDNDLGNFNGQFRHLRRDDVHDLATSTMGAPNSILPWDGVIAAVTSAVILRPNPRSAPPLPPPTVTSTLRVYAVTKNGKLSSLTASARTGLA